ncbi:MAG: 3-ketoacyl-CoA thiolase [Chlamydiia bacterium]|nr:3-ketoacyl-CoA thiolase [Chlamydiia bacterium]
MKIYFSAGYSTMFMGVGRPEFDPKGPRRPFDHYLEEVAGGIRALTPHLQLDEGVIGSFMAARFINQAHLAGFLPFMFPELKEKHCVAVEGACSTGGRALGQAIRSVLSGLSDITVAVGFEMQTTVKAVYGADILAGASFYRRDRKEGHAHFFPAIFDKRAGAYFAKQGEAAVRPALAKWYEQAIKHARTHPKAQEYANKVENLYERGMQPADPKRFLPNLNAFDCSKVSDGAAGILVFNEEGMKKLGLAPSDCVELIGMGEAERDITRPPEDLTEFSTMRHAAKEAFLGARLSPHELGMLEIHDCFSISALLALEAIGLAAPGRGFEALLEGIPVPVNLSGGLVGYGHPTGATGVRQMVDIWEQLTGRAPNQRALASETAMMVNMGGDDVTITSYILRSSDA